MACCWEPRTSIPYSVEKKRALIASYPICILQIAAACISARRAFRKFTISLDRFQRPRPRPEPPWLVLSPLLSRALSLPIPCLFLSFFLSLALSVYIASSLPTPPSYMHAPTYLAHTPPTVRCPHHSLLRAFAFCRPLRIYPPQTSRGRATASLHHAPELSPLNEQHRVDAAIQLGVVCNLG